MQRSSAPASAQLRIADLMAAFLAGLQTEDGKALVRFYQGTRSLADTISAVCAIARQSECDDIELTSCVTPGAVVIPIALAHGREANSARFVAAICMGYEAGIILGRTLGGAKALPAVWPTLTAAPFMAAVTVSFLNGYDEERLVHAMALSVAGANGRVGRPSGTPSGRWIAFAHAVHKGIRAAEAAGQGFKGDPLLYTDEWRQTQSGYSEIDRSAFAGPGWPGVDETDYKPFPIARQAATAVEAFQNLLGTGIDPATMEAIEAVVPRMNAAILSSSRNIGRQDQSAVQFGLSARMCGVCPQPALRSGTPGGDTRPCRVFPARNDYPYG